MTTPTPASILGTPSLDDVRSKLIGYLQAAQDPVTDWESGGVRRTQLEVSAIGLQDLIGVNVPGVAGSADLGTAPTVAWVKLAALQRYGLTARAATFTQQTVVLTCDGSHGPYTIAAGLIVASPITGHRYRAISGGTLNTSSTLTITVQAESPGATYADPPGTLTSLPNGGLPGVTASNTAPSFSGVSSTPTPALGLGVVTVTGTPPASATAYDFQIVGDGQNTTAKFQWRANGGAWSATTAMVAAFTIPTTAVVVHFANDAGGSTPSFRTGDLYSFTAPGSPITQFGQDEESAAQLATRCLARWPALTAGAAADKHTTWAKAASASVYRVHPAPDPTYPGRNTITIAGAPGTGALSGGVVAAVQLAMDQQDAVGDISLVTAAGVTTVTATGTATVSAAQLSVVQAAAALAWAAYVNGADIGGVIRLARLEQLLMDGGAIDVAGLQINGSAANLQLAADRVGVAADLVASITWVGV